MLKSRVLYYFCSMMAMNSQQEKNELLRAAFWPFVMALIMWLVKLVETLFHWRFTQGGVYPHHLESLGGIITMPFIHGDWEHLLSNTTPFLFLGTMLFYFYRGLAWKIFVLVWLLTGLWLWLGARESYHIGASGVVYGLVAFLFLSGVLRNNRRLLTLTLIVTFLYGSMIWGFFPEFFPDKNISWEGHLFGFLSGLLAAVALRKQGPKEDEFQWDDTDVPDDEDAYWRSEQSADKKSLTEDARPTQIHYHYREK